jgi:hypothetical protein
LVADSPLERNRVDYEVSCLLPGSFGCAFRVLGVGVGGCRFAFCLADASGVGCDWGELMKRVMIQGRVVSRPAYAHDVDRDLQVAVFQVVADDRKVTVVCRDDLAKGVSLSLFVGDAVAVYGWAEQLMGRWRVDAETVGHDLTVGSSVYSEASGWSIPTNQLV